MVRLPYSQGYAAFGEVSQARLLQGDVLDALKMFCNKNILAKKKLVPHPYHRSIRQLYYAFTWPMSFKAQHANKASRLVLI